MGGGGGGGGAGQEVGQLSRQQREIVSATFNIVRDRAKLTAEKFRENTVFLNLAQAHLREQVEELSEKMNSRPRRRRSGVQDDCEALPKAAEQMALAETDLKGQKARSADARAARAEAAAGRRTACEMQVQQSRGGGGGGGGGQSQMAEDLADLFELEMDKLANQYEMQQRVEQQGGDRQVDELAERLKELARRQQQEAERQRQLSAQGATGGGGGAQQRQLAQEVEEAARRLQQLQREQPRQDVSDAVRELQQAANAMRQAAANGQDGGAQAQAALEALRRAQQRLQKDQGGRGDRDLADVKRQVDELVNQQKEVESGVLGLEQQQGAGRQSKSQSLQQEKEAMDKKVAELQSEIEKLANETRDENRGAARKLDEAAGSITDKRIREMIRFTRNALQVQNPSDYTRAIEKQIGMNLEGLQEKLADAESALGQATKDNALDRALDDAGICRRGESLDQRMRDRAQGQQNQQGQQGQQGHRAKAKGQQGRSASSNKDSRARKVRARDKATGTGQNGQGQGQGQQAQGGPGQGGDNFGGGGAFGPNNGYGWGGDYRNWNGRFTPDDIRQFRRDLQELQNDASALRQRLGQAGVDPRELDEIMRQLRGLDNDAVFADPRNLASLQANALEKLKNFEFNLRKKAEGDDQPISLSGTDEVPAGFRTQIEEYYRSLARRPTK